MLIATPVFRSGLTALDAGSELPSRFRVLAWGENPSTKGPIRVGPITAEVFEANQRDAGFEDIALDFEHNTLPGSEEFQRTREPRAVAAYGAPRVVRGEGIFLENLRWTPEGEASARNYLDLSPAVEMSEGGEVLFMHSAALTRNGAVYGLRAFSVELPATARLHGVERAAAGFAADMERGLKGEGMKFFSGGVLPEVRGRLTALGTLGRMPSGGAGVGQVGSGLHGAQRAAAGFAADLKRGVNGQPMKYFSSAAMGEHRRRLVALGALAEMAGDAGGGDGLSEHEVAILDRLGINPRGLNPAQLQIELGRALGLSPSNSSWPSMLVGELWSRFPTEMQRIRDIGTQRLWDSLFEQATPPPGEHENQR